MMLTITPFIVKTCFPKSFNVMSLQERSLTEDTWKVIFLLEGFVSYFFDIENGGSFRVPAIFFGDPEPQREQNCHSLEGFA